MIRTLLKWSERVHSELIEGKIWRLVFFPEKIDWGKLGLCGVYVALVLRVFVVLLIAWDERGCTADSKDGEFGS